MQSKSSAMKKPSGMAKKKPAAKKMAAAKPAAAKPAGAKKMTAKKGKKAAMSNGSSGFKMVPAPYSTQSAVVPMASRSYGSPVVYA